MNEATHRVLADTGLEHWQQSSTHCYGRAILWEHGDQMYVTCGSWDEHHDEEGSPGNPFLRSTRAVETRGLELPPSWEEYMTEHEAVLWTSIDLELEEKPSGYPRWKGDALRGDVASVARRIEDDLYLRDRALRPF